MNFINRLERKFGKFAIPNLIMYIMIAYAIGYVLEMFNPDVYGMLVMSPELIVKGQVWRLFTWICTVPQEFGIFVIFMFMFYYWIGTTLERQWGTFKYNLYIFSGYLFMSVGAMLIYFITGLASNWEMALSLGMSTYYINLASFLAFATLFPDVQVYFMMILPIKIKWLAIVDAVYLAYECLYPLSYFGKYNISVLSIDGIAILSVSVCIVLSILNFLIFFFATRNLKRLSPKEVHRKREYKRQTMKMSGISKHKCAVCGRTDDDSENIMFRFCSKCDGNYEYCQDHLFTHEHIKK